MAHNHYVLATSLRVMAGLVPAIHAFVSAKKKDVDAPGQAGHDDAEGEEVLRYFVHHHLVGDAAQGGFLLDRL
jgi:hypothetical protein